MGRAGSLLREEFGEDPIAVFNYSKGFIEKVKTPGGV